MKHLFFSIALFFCAATTYAQTIADALRYSLQDPTGTARFAGSGGAFTALGADFGALSVNPAGAAMYRKGEFVIGTGLRFHETKTGLNGSNETYAERRNQFNLDNLGLVFSKHNPGRKWSTFNTIIGYNRIADYGRKYYYEGDAAGSIMNSYFDQAQAAGNNPDNWDPFGAGLAYEANAIYLDSVGNFTTDFEADRAATVNHRQFVSEKGGTGELQFGFAGTYKERLMLGITAGVPLVNYSLSSSYDEVDQKDGVEYFRNLNATETLRTEGVGFNMKLGLIYRATQSLRLGAAFHTPSFINLNDSYRTDFSYAYTDGSGDQSSQVTSPDGLFDYKFNTPFRTSVGAAYIFGTNGFVSADVELVDYANSVFDLTSDVNSSGNSSFQQELNRGIEQAYTSAVNLRLGGELALDEFRLRGGFQHLGNPYATGGSNRQILTGGIGYRDNDFYLDLAYRNIQRSFGISAYEGLRATADAVNHDFILTLGFKF